jgi:hypothetical protein
MREVRSWSPRDWGNLGRLGQWRVPGRRLMGLMSGYAVRVTQPLRPVGFWVRSDRASEVWSRDPCDWAIEVSPGSRGSQAGVCIEVPVAYAVRVARPSQMGYLVRVSEPRSRDASSKATPVYHPRG